MTGRAQRRGQPLLLAFLTLLGPHPLTAQDHLWELSAHMGGMRADGEFQALRANGKTVRSDIDGGPHLTVRIERRLGERWGVAAGLEGSPSRSFRIDQDFPDGTDFSSADSFDYEAVTLGAVYRLGSAARLGVRIEGYLSLARYDDVLLAVAGPPYDRTAPLDVDIDSRPGLGLAITGALPVGRALSLQARTGLAVQRFQGRFPADPSLPGTDGDIDVPIHPVYLALGVGYAF